MIVRSLRCCAVSLRNAEWARPASSERIVSPTDAIWGVDLDGTVESPRPLMINKLQLRTLRAMCQEPFPVLEHGSI